MYKLRSMSVGTKHFKICICRRLQLLFFMQLGQRISYVPFPYRFWFKWTTHRYFLLSISINRLSSLQWLTREENMIVPLYCVIGHSCRWSLRFDTSCSINVSVLLYFWPSTESPKLHECRSSAQVVVQVNNRPKSLPLVKEPLATWRRNNVACTTSALICSGRFPPFFLPLWAHSGVPV